MYHKFVNMYFLLEISTDGETNVFEARSESPKIQEACHSFLLNISTRKTYFSEVIMKRLRTGTWSTSSLISHREGIIPRWSQLLTTSKWQGVEGSMVKRNDGCLNFG